MGALQRMVALSKYSTTLGYRTPARTSPASSLGSVVFLSLRFPVLWRWWHGRRYWRSLEVNRDMLRYEGHPLKEAWIHTNLRAHYIGCAILPIQHAMSIINRLARH